MMWMVCSSTEEDDRIYHNARILVALRECLKKLREFYKTLDSTYPPFIPNQPHPRYFPYPTSFIAEDGTLIRFQYLKSLEDHPTCVTYLAAITEQKGATCAGENVVVKFVRSYGRGRIPLLALPFSIFRYHLIVAFDILLLNHVY